ncbi:MAG: DUF262 domain-containing protein [Desulfovibrionaceae bacterium]|nr:DUF262 domain-containing protein [Desulfovibrionaceae bacterium]MBF0513331.1 DUF262 domain-containing protein [Desulfovibrionaceae bacterium]
MELISPSESNMWDKSYKAILLRPSDEDINKKYEKGEQRIVTESNREKLPNFVDALRRPNYMELRPFYQRRNRWDTERQSKLIESFIMNVPVPPLFLYEKNFNSYEVMDGQQRISAIKSFYDNEFKLKGLQQWSELNGRTYKTLPSKIRAGIDRRSIAYIVLLKESAPDAEEALLLRQIVFERLNTGGIKLERQEIRNSMNSGAMNDLLHLLSRNKIFRRSWSLPEYSDEENINPAHEIKKHKIYEKMEDLEIILRFFALRHVERYTKGMQGFLDLYMIKSATFTNKDVEILENLFIKTLTIAHEIYQGQLFKPYNINKNIWSLRPHKSFYDSVMVGISKYINYSEKLLRKKTLIVESTKKLFLANPEGTFTGRGNTKADIERRISLYQDMLKFIIS